MIVTMEKLNHLFEDKNFYSRLNKLALPIMFQSLMLAAVAAADALMLGSVEQNAMAAVSLATQIQFVQNMILMAVVSATTILGAQYWGKGDVSSLKDIFAIGLRWAVIVDVLFWAGCVFFPEYLMLIFTGDEVLIEIGARYLRIAGWSYLVTGISQCYLTLMKVSEHAKHTAFISSLSVVINIILNAVLIYGLFGMPVLEVCGAAYATLIARIFELALAVIYSFKKDFVTPELRRLFRHVHALSVDFTKCVLPLLGASLFWGVGFTSYTAFMGHLGADAAASNSVASVIRDLVCCFCNGISSGGGILVGNELGAGNLEKGRIFGDRLVILSVLIGFASTLIMLILTPVVMKMVKLTPEAHSYLCGMMVIMAIYMIGRTMNTIIINGIFAAGGDTLFDMYSLAVVMWMLAVPLAALGTFVFHWPVLIVYACTCVDEVGKIPWVLVHYKKYKWVKDLTRDMKVTIR